MSFKKINHYTLVQQAQDMVPGFKESYFKFLERVTIDQNSKSTITNYTRSIAQIALHFGRVPQQLSIEEVNLYLYGLSTHESHSISYFKHSIYSLRYWFRLFNMEDKALKMPPVKRKETLPTVLSKQECKELFKAPRNYKHRFLLAFAYSSGLRMNELRHLRISDVDLDRKQIHVRQGKGKKDRYVILSNYISYSLPEYLKKINPQVFLFEGLTTGAVMGERSIQYIIREAHQKTTIRKDISMHTLRHSYATHLLEDGLDIFSVQRLLGHADIRSTMVYLHVAQINPTKGHSPLDTLYNIK